MIRSIKTVLAGGIITGILIVLSSCAQELTPNAEKGYKDPVREFSSGQYTIKRHTGSVTYGTPTYALPSDPNSRAFISAFEINSIKYACIVVDNDIRSKTSFQARVCFTVPSIADPLGTNLGNNFNICTASPTVKVRANGTSTFVDTTSDCNLTATFSSPADTSLVNISWTISTIDVDGTTLNLGGLTQVPRVPY